MQPALLPLWHTHVICLLDTAGSGADGLHCFISTGQGAAVLSWGSRGKKVRGPAIPGGRTPTSCWGGHSTFPSWGCKSYQVSCLLVASIVEAAPHPLPPSFQPWQGPASTAPSQSHCPVGPDDDCSSLATALSHFLSQTRLDPLQATCHLALSVGTPLLTSSCTSSSPPCSQRKQLRVWAQHSFSPVSPQACQQTVAAVHTQSSRSLEQELGSKKAMFGVPPKRESEVPGKVTKPSRGEAPQGG